MFISKRKPYNKLYLSLTAAAVLLQTHNVYSETLPTCTGTLTFNGLTTCGTDNYIDGNSTDDRRINDNRQYTQCSTSSNCTLPETAPTCTGRELKIGPQGYNDSSSYPICSDHFIGNYTCSSVLNKSCFQLTNGDKGCVGTYCIAPKPTTTTENSSSGTESSSTGGNTSGSGGASGGSGSSSSSGSSAGSGASSSGGASGGSGSSSSGGSSAGSGSSNSGGSSAGSGSSNSGGSSAGSGASSSGGSSGGSGSLSGGGSSHSQSSGSSSKSSSRRSSSGSKSSSSRSKR